MAVCVWPASQTLSDNVVISEAHINRTVFFGNELQELHIGEVIVRDIARDAAGVCRQEVAFEEDFKMFAQHAHSAGYRRIEIDVQIADKVVSHAINLYPRILCVKGINARRFRGDFLVLGNRFLRLNRRRTDSLR